MRTTLPGPGGLPFVGVLFDFLRDPLGWLTEAHSRYGDTFAYRVGPFEVVQLHHPADIEAVLVKEAGKAKKDVTTRDLARVIGDGLLTGEGDHWRKNRRLLAPLLTRPRISRYAGTFVTATRLHADRLRAREQAEVSSVFMELAFDIVTEALFGGAGSNKTGTGARSVGQQIAHDVETLMREYSRTIQSWPALLPEWVPIPGRRRFEAAVRRLHRVTDQLVLEATPRSESREDLVSRLVDARDEEGRPMSPGGVRDEALTMLLAGHETTALALTYAAWVLAHDPALQDRVAAELASTLGGADPTFADLERLPLTAAVFHETLRLYSPAWLIGREVVEPFALPSSGVVLPVGVQVFLPQWAVHRDPRWWPDPLRFRPERFLEPDAARPRFAYFPFGGGPRVCIGIHFAEAEGVLALATLLQRLRFAPAPGAGQRALEFAPSITLRPRAPVVLRISRR